MMESCLAGKPVRVGPLEVEDIRKDLLQDFSSQTQDNNIINIKQQKENLQVYLRIRPLTSTESTKGESQDCVCLEGEDTVVLKAPTYCLSSWHSDKSLPQTVQKFNFTKVLGPDSSQRQVFEGTVSPLVRGVLEGRDSVVFTYGVTNAGKTFTFLGPEHDGGVLPRSLSVLFRSIEGRVSADCSLKPQRCKDITKLTPLQQTNEAARKNQLLKLLKQSDSQKLSCSQSSTCSSEGDSRISSASSSANGATESDSFHLNIDSTTEFSVWVSFCEIYRENIHDLLETQAPRAQRRSLLRLAQDVKGNSFIKDLRWVQVHSAEEAYRIMKIGKKNQSLFSTKLNQLSSRSHSMFSIRILRLENTGVIRVKSVSEMCLCDLAGSERCTRTQSQGQRLKEAGNINTSLLTLGKCLNAMRLNQHHRIHQHVPFRESKLTHFLQGFLCGRGAVCMIVNISQCPSAYDETLNVLKFSALAQKVVVLNSRPVLPPVAPLRSAREVSMIINQAGCQSDGGRERQNSMVAWETSLEDVQEEDDDDDDDEEMEDEDEECMDEDTVLEAGHEEGDLREVLELQIREEVSAEFMELFERMERDYSERLVREREILEERAEHRLEILKTLVSKTCLSATNEEERKGALEQMVAIMAADLQKIKRDAEEAHTCLTDTTGTQVLPAELETLRLDQQRSHDQLETLRLDQQRSHDQLKATQERVSELMEACQQKDDIISKLKVSMETADTQLTRLQLQLREKNDTESSLSKLLEDAKSRLQNLDLKLEEKTKSIDLLTQEADVLRQETSRRREEEEGASIFRAAVEEMRREAQDAVEKSAQKSQHIAQLRALLTSSQSECVQLRDDLANQREESFNLRQAWQTEKRLLQQQAEGLTVQLKASEVSCAKGTIVEERLAESEAQCAALQQRLREKDLADEERKAQDEKEKEELRLALSSLQERLTTERQTDTSSPEPNSHKRGEEEVGGVEERKATVVEELKEELERFHQRREEEMRRAEEEKRGAEFEAVKREMERLQERENEQKAPNTRNHRRKKSLAHPNTRNQRKRKIQELHENDTKRNRLGETRVQAPDGTLQRILDSPSLLSSTAKSILSLVGSRSGEKEAVVVERNLKRGRKKLFKKDISSPLLTLAPHTTMEGSA